MNTFATQNTLLTTLRAALTATLLSVGLLLSLTPNPAAAATYPASVWDRLAMCESSGNWSINTGNGYYGGVQFSRTTWAEFGGTDYAERADYASKAAQIFIATRVWREQGWKAWPACAAKLGLTIPPPAARAPRRPLVPAAVRGALVLNIARTPHRVVAANSAHQTYTPFRVRAGVKYRFVATGLYRFNRSASRADASCSTWGGTWKQRPPRSSRADQLNLLVGLGGGQVGRWRPRDGAGCDVDHVYYLDYRPTRSGKILLSTRERTRSDNYGTLYVHVLAGGARIGRI